MEEPIVLVLLATYNGAAYIRQMVDSVLGQDYPNIRIILSDDGSTDATVSILDEYAAKIPDRVTHYRSGRRFGCAQKHFLHLLRTFRDAPYIMFCDQDDVWHPDKIEKTLAVMRSLETDPAVPVLVHTDLRVVDGNLQETAPSFCRLSNLDGNRTALNQLLVQNVVTGCTVMLNRSLAALACRKPIAGNILMHDWWLAILAAATGKVGFLPEATIDYRQHGTNSVGAKNARSLSYLWKRFTTRDTRRVLVDTARQTALFLSCYSDLLQPPQLSMLTDFANTAEAPWHTRISIYRKHRIWKYGTLRVLAQIIGG